MHNPNTTEKKITR